MTTCTLEPQAACLPVTALKSVLVDGELLLLAGQGPFLHIYDGDGVIIASTRVFEIQPVCGIQIDSHNAGEVSSQSHRVVLWGGALCRTALLTLNKVEAAPSPAVPELCFSGLLNCGDWILDAAFHQSSILLLNAHNQLLEVPILENTGKGALECGRPAAVTGPRSFLYSGSLAVSKPGLVIVASGTVFGEILVWTCSREENHRQWSSSLRHVFNGHRGSVFGVSISDVFELGPTHTRLLASCSDDRTVRLWDISDCDRTQPDSSSGMESAETGFGRASQVGETQIASAWGHLSRIWGVGFVQEQASNNSNSVCLLSRGEDGACQLWTIELQIRSRLETPLTALLRPESSDRHHSGKNAWSMTQINDGQGLLVHTGGADGQIISRRVDVSRGSLASFVTHSIPFKDITGSSMSLKHYLLLNSRECLAATDPGELFRLTYDRDKLNWSKLMPKSGNGGLVLCPTGSLQLVLVAYQRGGLSALRTNHDSLVPVKCDLEYAISWMRFASPRSTKLPESTTCIVAVLANKKAVILWVSMNDASIQVRHTPLETPETFIITSCCYDSSSEVLVLGSRAGALAIYSHVRPHAGISEEPFCLRHAHGTDSVTSITILRKDAAPSTETIHILTTGRDGIYAIHRVNWSSSTDRRGPIIAAVHRSALPFGPNIEDAFFTSDAGSSPVTEPDLVLCGFRSTSFVVWNETQQSELLSVECGGAHRSWAFRDSSSVGDGVEKSFIWSKAGRLNWHSAPGSGQRVIQEGGQGREIKAVARSPLPYNRVKNEHHARVLIATGAEDTNIQLYAIPCTPKTVYRPQPTDFPTFRAVATLKRHTTGIQHLQFSPSGEHLFSSAGCEEFYVWKLSFDVPGIEAGVVLWDIMPTEEEDSDARIMSFDLRCGDHGDKNSSEEYTIVMAYSNGKAKVVRYTPAPSRNQAMFETLREISYGSFCVMQAFFLLPSFVSASGFRPDEHQVGALSAGTNGFLNLVLLDTRSVPKKSAASPAAELPSQMEVHRVHQSSVLAMDMVSLSPTTYLVATGGDDNALGLTLITSAAASTMASKGETNTERQSFHRFRTIVLPAAHAAALTALKTTKPRRTPTGYSVVVVTAGNDQRVNVWNVHIDSERDGGNPVVPQVEDDGLLEAVQVELVGTGWTAVADASDLEVIEGVHDTVANGDEDGGKGEYAWRILVVGVGMELLKVTSIEAHGRS
ncbi:uncharacterized protein Z520_10405 [Fonsecaea multimorphosa CBS 102226]|uniref:Uncharacterized protein n=1 Tax=Fonsecaea multimorphosa CBS 102226 TaxID=1442371 RepID=A0A0D2I9C8_9EURO|nr:uncharacterized protein Z520_10405 [Fonsecaea multimorphosa CBS 102226]KIX93781.1 hypothetical protein Z520_10405 [Fonsecaea multimorphosa CBS 102226]OAL19210.1 hypothetical protein AYO22_09971 [Fonsecaea multimorphosa]